MRLRLTAMGMGTLLFSGCYEVQLVRVGPDQPAFADNCPIQYAKLTVEQARAQGEEEVGSGCVQDSGDGDLNQTQKSRVQKQACQLGGDMVIVTGTCVLPMGRDSVSGVQVMVLRASKSGS